MHHCRSTPRALNISLVFIHSIAIAGKHLACLSLCSSTIILCCAVLYSLLETAQIMPRAPSRMNRQSAPPYVDPTVFGALSIADLRSLCVQRGLTSTGTRKTLERRLRGLTIPSLSQNIAGPAAQSGPNIPNNDTAAPRPDFTEGQM